MKSLLGGAIETVRIFKMNWKDKSTSSRSFAPIVPSKTFTRFQTKMGKVYTRFQTWTAQKTLPFGAAHTYMAYIRIAPSHPPEELVK